MNKLEFLETLGKRISSLPEDDIERSLEYYSEIIDDRVEDGLFEEDAVSQLGSMDEIVSQILSEISFAKIVKKKAKPNRVLRVWEIVLLVLGSPIWISLIVAVFAVVLSLYVSLWSVIISLWAAFASVVACAPAAVALGIGLIVGEKLLLGIAMVGAGLVCAGASVFFFFGCKGATVGILLLTKKMALAVKKCFVGKEKA